MGKFASYRLENYGKNDLNENQLVILCSALKQDLNSSDLLFNKMLPFMVNHIGSLNEYADFKEIIKKRHLVLPYLQSLDALFMIRYGDISTWKAPVENFVDSDTVVFIKAIKTSKNSKQKLFRKSWICGLAVQRRNSRRLCLNTNNLTENNWLRLFL